MKTNIKFKFNDNALKRSIGNAVLEISCPKCQQKIKTTLNRELCICSYCNAQIILNNNRESINNITNTFKKAFK